MIANEETLAVWIVAGALILAVFTLAVIVLVLRRAERDFQRWQDERAEVTHDFLRTLLKQAHAGSKVDEAQSEGSNYYFLNQHLKPESE